MTEPIDEMSKLADEIWQERHQRSYPSDSARRWAESFGERGYVPAAPSPHKLTLRQEVALHPEVRIVAVSVEVTHG